MVQHSARSDQTPTNGICLLTKIRAAPHISRSKSRKLLMRRSDAERAARSKKVSDTAMTTIERARRAINALREPDASLLSVANTVRQSIADVIEDSGGETERLRNALANFADPKNWHSEAGLLQWMGKRNAIEFAQSVLDGE